MYVGAQRVIDDGHNCSVTIYLYLHGGLSPQQQSMLNDVRWVSQLARGQLARESHEGRAGGRRVISYLEVSGPDETDSAALARVLDELAAKVAAGYKGPIQHEAWGAEFYRGVEVDEDPEQELAELRARLESFFDDGGTTPPLRELTILVHRDGERTLYEWDEDSRARLLAAAPQWSPTRFHVSDEVRDDFQLLHGALFPHVLYAISPSDVDIAALGGVAFKDEISGRVLWFSPMNEVTVNFERA